MKMRSRLLTVILSAAMVLSMTSPVLAEEGTADTTVVTQEAEGENGAVSTETKKAAQEPVASQATDSSSQGQQKASSSSAATSGDESADSDTQAKANSTQTQTNDTVKENRSETTQEGTNTASAGNEKAEDTENSSVTSVSSVALQIKKDGNFIAVPENKEVDILFDKTSAYLLEAKVSPESASEKKVTYHSDREDIVSTDTDGRLRINAVGTAHIWAEAGGISSDKVTLIISKSDSAEKTAMLKKNVKQAGQTENWTIDNKVKMFQVTNAEVSGTGNNRILKVTLSGQGYHYLYKGKKAEADAASKESWIKGTEVSGQYSFNIPVSVSETVIPISARSEKYRKWYGRQFTLDWDKKTLTVENEPAAETVSVSFQVKNESGEAVTGSNITVTGSDGKTVSASTDGSYTLTAGSVYTVKASADGYADGTISYTAKTGETSAVITLGTVSNNVHTDALSGTDLADGTYTNIKVQKSGGLHDTTGITISKVTVSNGKATAEITWKSNNKVTHFLLGYLDNKTDDPSLYNAETQAIGSPYKDYCYAVTSRQEGGSFYSTATIPVQLGSAFSLSVRYPDAMSTPYWSKYDVTIQVDTGEKTTQKVYFQATDADGKEINTAAITVTGSDGKSVTPDADGGYTLYRDASYHITAEADGYYSASQDYTVTGDDSVKLKLTQKEAGTLDLTVKNNLNMFKVVSASVTGSGANRILAIALSGQGYHYLFKGNTQAASVSKTSERIKYQVNSNGLYEFRIPVAASESTFDLSALSAREQKWYSRQLTLDWNSNALTVNRGSGETIADQRPADFSDSTDNTSRNNKSDTEETSGKGATSGSSVSNGYTFRWSGGSGRAIITCQRIFEQNGQLYATIHFSRANGGTSAYTQVRVNGQTISGSNTFTIPVNKNANTTIEALTTAMSAPHWITYTIYVGEGGSAENSLTSNTKQLDETAPEITGLTAKGEVEITYSDMIKIFAYEKNIYLIEVNMVKDTARKEESSQSDSTAAEDQPETTAASTETEDTGDEEEKIYSDSDAGASAVDVYSNDVVKYLVVPENQEIPAGLDKDVVIIQQPTDKTFVTSPEALKILSELGKTGDMNALGLDKDDVEDDSVRAALEKKDGEEGKIYQAGSYDKWDLKTLIKQESNFAIESSKILPQDEKTEEEDMKSYNKLVSQAIQMNMAMFVDRSADEKNDLAKAEWYKVYGVIFDAQDQAEELYKKVVDSATEQEKKDAVEALTAEKSEEK